MLGLFQVTTFIRVLDFLNIFTKNIKIAELNIISTSNSLPYMTPYLSAGGSKTESYPKQVFEIISNVCGH